MVGAARFGMRFVAATPPGYEPDGTAVTAARRAAVQMGGTVELVSDPREAARDADAVYTDVWTSMGQEDEAEKRRSDLADYRIDSDLLQLAADDAIVLHCLPAHYGEEITEDVLYGPQSAVWDQAENRLHAQKALMALTIRLVLPLKDNVPTRHFPLVTLLLVAVNVAVWIFYQLPDLEGSTMELAYQPCEVTNTCPPGTATGENWPVTAVTSMFMHGSWLHLIGNMLFLWIFGNNVEDAMGKIRYLLFYFGAGFTATALQTIVTLSTSSGVDTAIPNLGASGAVSGVLGAYLVLLPTARVLTIVVFFLIEVPAFLFLGFWFLFQLWSGGLSLTEPEAGGGVAFFAHIGGFAFGLLTVRLFAGGGRPLRPRY